MRLYFIGGASGSGKTAMMLHLKELLGDTISVYDFDDIGVPENADTKWRQESTEKWLKKLLSEGKDSCLLGQIVLGEILSCPSAQQIGKVNFCLLDVSDFERVKRLKKRNYGADQNMLNWSAWLRMHHQDPKWAPDSIQEFSANVMDFGKLNQLTSYNDVADVRIIDTTDLALNEVAQKVTDWINELDVKPFEIVKSQNNDVELIDNNIVEYNNSKVPFLQQESFKSLNFCIKDDKGLVVAGVNAVMYCWGMLYIDVLFTVDGNRA